MIAESLAQVKGKAVHGYRTNAKNLQLNIKNNRIPDWTNAIVACSIADTLANDARIAIARINDVLTVVSSIPCLQ